MILKIEYFIFALYIFSYIVSIIYNIGWFNISFYHLDENFSLDNIYFSYSCYINVLILSYWRN